MLCSERYVSVACRHKWIATAIQTCKADAISSRFTLTTGPQGTCSVQFHFTYYGLGGDDRGIFSIVNLNRERWRTRLLKIGVLYRSSLLGTVLLALERLQSSGVDDLGLGARSFDPFSPTRQVWDKISPLKLSSDPSARRELYMELKLQRCGE